MNNGQLLSTYMQSHINPLPIPLINLYLEEDHVVTKYEVDQKEIAYLD